jgi:hypothetical protein
VLEISNLVRQNSNNRRGLDEHHGSDKHHCCQHIKPARVGGNPVGRAGIDRTPAAENPEIAALTEDSSSAKKLLTFISRHTADIAGLSILWPI